MNKLNDDNKLTGKRKSQTGEQSQLPPFSQPSRAPECQMRWQRCSGSNKLVNHCYFIALKLIVMLINSLTWRDR